MNTIQNKLAGRPRTGRVAFAARLKLGLMLGFGLLAVAAGAAPGNDNFTNAVTIAGQTGIVIGSNVGATLEACEPTTVNTDDYGVEPVDSSVWYQWTAPASGTVTMDTTGSTFDTVLAVYTDATNNLCDASLTLVGADDDNNTFVAGTPSQLSFPVVAGTTYYISVNTSVLGFDDTGAVVLNWNLPASVVPTIPSGTFQFTKSLYVVSELDSMPPLIADNATVSGWSDALGNLGARVTVTRVGGSSGRVFVDYNTVGGQTYTNQFITNYFGTNISFTLIDTNGVGWTTNSLLNFTVYTNNYQTMIGGVYTYYTVVGALTNSSTQIYNQITNGIFHGTNSAVVYTPLVPVPTNYPPLITNFFSLTNLIVRIGTTNIVITNIFSTVTTSRTTGTNAANGSTVTNGATIYTNSAAYWTNTLTAYSYGTNIFISDYLVGVAQYLTNYYYTNLVVSGLFITNRVYTNGLLSTNLVLTSQTLTGTNSFMLSSSNNVGSSTNFTSGTGVFTPVPTSLPPLGVTNIGYSSISSNGIGTIIASTNTYREPLVVVYQVVNASGAFTPNAGTLVFDDYQMSQDIIVPVAPSGSPNGAALPSISTVIGIQLTNARLDSLESSDLEPPTVGGGSQINILSSLYPPLPTVFNIERSSFQVDKDVPGGVAIVSVYRTGGLGCDSVSVPYSIDPTPPANGFTLQSGSDYATPDSDFTRVTGTLTWGSDDFNPKTISVPIPIHNNGLVENNEDLLISLGKPTVITTCANPASSDPKATVGLIGTATLTILFDDLTCGQQPAGAVDRCWNVEGSYASLPPFLTYPGTQGSVSGGAYGNGGTVYAVAEQPNGEAILAGSFISYDDNTYNRIVRVLNNGYQDTTFLAYPNSGANNFIAALALYPASSTNFGKILIGGKFTAFNGYSRYHIARLNSDGSVDTSFNPGLGVQGANAMVWSIALQTNGQVVIAGNFSAVNGTNTVDVARLNADGSLDTSFNPGTGPDGTVNSVVVDPLGRVIIGGDFENVSGVLRGGVARLNVNGSLDATFNPGIGTYDPDTGYTDPVYALALQPNGQLVVGGAMSFFQLASYNGIVRLNPDGSVDTTFNPGSGPYNGTYNPVTGVADTVSAITLQPDGNILIGGDFTTYNQTRRVGIARLFSFGSLDTSFMDVCYNQFAGLINHYHNPNAVNPALYPPENNRNFVDAIAVEPGTTNVVIGGSFLRVGGGATRDDAHPRSNVARLIGGGTPGPGNIQFCNFQKPPNVYQVNKSGGSLFVSLTRTNGSLGPISATFSTNMAAPGPGVASVDDFTLTTPNTPIWPSIYSVSPALSWMVSPGFYGPNYNTTPLPLAIPPDPQIILSISNNPDITGNVNANFALSSPDGSSFTLMGGEKIPLGAALGWNDAAKMTIIDNNYLPGVLGFSSPTYTVNENGTNATITVVRTNFTGGVVQVSYATSDGTGTNGVNYTATSGTLTFQTGDSSKTFTIPIINGTTFQPDKTVNLTLSTPAGGATLGLTNAVLTIVNNNSRLGHISFTSATYSANETDGTALIGVSRLGGSQGTISVTMITSDGTATNGLNYVGTTNVLTWNSGVVGTKTVAIPVIHDGLFTPTLTVNLVLTNGVLNSTNNNAVLGFGGTNAVLNIVNVDFPGMVAFSSRAYSVKKYGGFALIPVVRTGGSAGTISVDYNTVDGMALAGVNYTATNGTLTFTNGQVAEYFNVPITAGATNGLVSLNLVLTNAALVGNVTPWNALGSPSNAVLNIIDTTTVNEIPGAPDVTYNAFGFNGPVYALTSEPNNQLLVGGDFTFADGVYRQRIARLNADGSLDPTFSLPSSAMGADASVRTVAVQTDGRILVGGYFTNLNSVAMHGIARLNNDGSLDSLFNPGSGANSPVYAAAETFVNGVREILVGGGFSLLNGQGANGVGRLNDDGTPDAGFNFGGLGANGTVYALAVQADGRILIGGDFTQVNGINASHIARLNVNGSVDLTFTNASASDSVRAIVIQPDGQILAGGLFTSVSGNTNFNHLARFNSADGSPDSTFTPGFGANDAVFSIALQTDTRIILGGQFTQASGVTRNRITRLNPDGTVDPTINFGVGADSSVSAVVVQEDTITGYPTNVPDEKIIIGGSFLNYYGESHPYLARIYGGSIGGSGAFEFSSANYGVNENGGNVVITVNRTGGTSGTNVGGTGDIYVPFATSNGTAQAGVNYSSVLTNIDFPMGEVQKTIAIPVVDDQVITSNLTVNLAVNPVPPAEYGDQPTAVLTITNVDSAISFSAATYLATKYGSNVLNGFVSIYVTRLGATYGASTVVFNTTTNGTATAGVDYQAQTNVLVTFAPGVTSQQVNVPIINGLSDGNTTVGLQLTNVTGSILSSPSNAVLTILDQTLAKGSFVFSSSNYVVSAGGGAGQTLATITVLRTNGASGIVSVSYNTTNGTALAGLQYISTSGILTFGDGVMSQTFTVPVFNTSVANVALNLSLLLSNPTGGAGLVSPTNATLTILNTNTGFYFAAATNSAPENSGFVSLTVLRNNTNGQAAVDFYTADGTGTNAAINGTNYVGQGGTLVFVNGQLSTNIIVPLIYNPLVTGDLVFTVGLTNANQAQLIAPSNAVVVVQDADAGINFTNAAMSVLKNGTNAVVAVVCSNPRVEPVSVSYFTADGTATNGIDYTATNGTLVFTNGVTTNYVTVPILNNQLLEGNVNFTVVLTNATYPGQLVSPSTNTVTIIDSNPGISFSSPVYAVAKTGVQALINVYRTGYTNSAASVNFATANGTASAGSDYVATNGTLVFTNGVTNLTFAVTVVNKLGVQPPKTVLLSLSSPTNAIMLAPTNAVLSILNDTNTAFAFALATNSVPENAGFVAVTVTRFNNPVGTVSVAFGTTNGTAVAGLNYTATNSVLTFTNGQMSQTIIVPLIYDPLVTGDLAFTVGLSSPSVGQLIAPSVTTVIVQDADAGVSFTNAATTVLKNGTNAVLAVVCSNPRVEPVSVGYFTADGTATNGIDYTATNGTLVFAGGVTTNFITVPILNNQLLEGNVNFTVVLTNAAYPGQLVSPTTNTVTIIDSNPGISFSSAVYSADKTSVQAVISVNRTGYTNSVMSVNFATANGTAASGSDYVATNGTLVFTNGVTSQTFTVTLINHLLVQPPKTVLLSLLNATNAIMVAPTNAVLTITDTNAGVIFASASYSFIETTPVATINVLRYNNTSGTNTVNWSTTNGPAVPGIGAALAGINYSAIVNQPLTFYPGVTNLTVFVPLLYNTNATGPVQLTAGLASSSPGVVVGTPGATVIVLQDADAGLSFSTNAGTVLKNAGSITVTVICSNTNVEPVSVNYSTTNGTAAAGTDYTATSGTLTFSNGVSSLSFPVPITNNGLITGNRVFYVNLSGPTGTGRLVYPSQQTVTIDDSNSGLKFSSATYTVLKTNGPAVITVYRTDNTNTTSTVNYAATNGTAVNGVNFVATTGTLVFTNGVTSQTFTVPIIPTLTVQPDLTVVLTLSAPVNGTLLIPSAATLTIRDNTGSYVIPAGSQLLSETGAGAPNGLIDSNETVQVLFALRDAAGLNVNNLIATLQATNGVTGPSPSSQVYGPLTSYGHSVSMPFTFTAHGSNNQQIAATFKLQDGTTNIGTAVFGYTLGTASAVFSNNAVIVINDNAAASPYPSVINVSGVGGSLVKATVTLVKFAHTDPHDVSALVTAPAGTNTLIMSHTGGNGFGVTNLVLTFDDTATNSLPSSGAITSGTNRPTRYTPPNSFP